MLAQILPIAALLALVDAHAVILDAQGESGSPPSVGFQVNAAIARNCTTINPCQMDTTIIRDAEIAAGTVNSCGRTKLTGNIDVGEATENALAANGVTQVKSGTEIQVTIHQVNADGAGPYFCDLDETSNTGIFSHNLSVTNNIPGANGLSQAKAQDFNITVTMPQNFTCIGGSTGNICTVRCRNNAQAGPFGGCFAVQQTDTKPNDNRPANIKTSETLEHINSEVASNQAALPAAVKANQNAGGTEQEQNLAAVNAILGLTSSSALADFPTQTPSVDLGGAPAATATAVPTTGTNNGGRGRGRGGNGNGNGNANGRTQNNGNGRNRGGNVNANEAGNNDATN
ncbi:hypothetical protein C8A03DRAFT_19017 [Achaetomium macrosporum]|uniref:GEgh 16 protein n=1 Tax=Achaetomium macrosporum TaxID=79813 RepID=A0AAN7C275_9PEZI|nr:hypothetical protein C8A03DRAFT_19017 [Achaetomium macrosporum]